MTAFFMSEIYHQWQALIHQQSELEYFKSLQQEISKQRQQGEMIFPLEQDVLSAFSYCDLSEVKVVILGQDPYHGEGANQQPQAHGLAFSVNHGIKIPPSLVNIYKELTTDINGFSAPSHGNLVEWAKQGVLLLNTVLTVKKGQAHSHAKLGWEIFTDAIIDAINAKNTGCVFILWGSHAQKVAKRLDNNKHAILSGPHPSPLSAYRGFFGCQHFSKANQWLQKMGKTQVNWQLNEIHTEQISQSESQSELVIEAKRQSQDELF